MPAIGSTEGPRPQAKPASVWTLDVKERLARLWTEEGLSAGEIAKSLSESTRQDIGRNAVMARIRRMGLTGRGQRASGSGRIKGQAQATKPAPQPKCFRVVGRAEREPHQPASMREREAHKPSSAPLPPANPGALHAPGRWPLVDMRPLGQCKFACAEEGGRHLFCGEPAPIGPGNPHGSWCDVHRPKVFEERASLGRPAFLKRRAMVR